MNIIAEICGIELPEGLTFRGMVCEIQKKSELKEKQIEDGLIFMLYQELCENPTIEMHLELLFNRFMLRKRFIKRYGAEDYKNYLRNSERLKQPKLDEFAENLIKRPDLKLNEQDKQTLKGMNKGLLEPIIGSEELENLGDSSWQQIAFNIITDYRIRERFYAYIIKYGAEELREEEDRAGFDATLAKRMREHRRVIAAPASDPQTGDDQDWGNDSDDDDDDDDEGYVSD